ncbi:UxaA family hydrolase [Spirochaeta cellobiosiphila]|uniref:UxaA family hydrolase n=1 Tax=Spirochaeta cellobiosiphila TaxID=504483 RepID=UPI0003F7FA1C|nr:altronate dehydratase family protein [Spirochaeta cellobiosiphila]
MNLCHKIHELDNVAVALQDLTAGTEISIGDQSFALKTDVPMGHKFALVDIEDGGQIIKYGTSIGSTKTEVPQGTHLHTHNVKTNLSDVLEYSYEPAEPALPVSPAEHNSFMGYRRANGKVGIRNEIWIINTVGCVNKTAEMLAREATATADGRHDGVYTFSHPYGCSQMGGDQLKTQQVLAGLARHPNAGGVLVLGLGCENNHIAEFKKVLGEYDPKRIRFLSTQDVSDEIEAGHEIIEELAEILKEDKRTECPVSDLVIGLKCGGSDGFSGITANPLIGRVADKIVATGGTAILTEVPEMFGAEHFLMSRAKDESVFKKTVDLVNNFKLYFQRYDQVVYENPSPGNKAGGITTLEDKSCGCIQKGGTSPVVDVLDYTESPKLKGLNLLNGPGNDGVSVTNMIAAGAQIVLFSTGRGNPLGGPAPTLKIATNTPLAEKKPRWIDFNAGRLLEGNPEEQVTNELYELILEVANGKKAKNEISGYKEIAIFKDGVTL